MTSSLTMVVMVTRLACCSCVDTHYPSCVTCLQAYTIPTSCLTGVVRQCGSLKRAIGPNTEPLDSDMWRLGPNGEIVMLSNDLVTSTVLKFIEHGALCPYLSLKNLKALYHSFLSNAS
jgi:hypothetical protein